MQETSYLKLFKDVMGINLIKIY